MDFLHMPLSVEQRWGPKLDWWCTFMVILVLTPVHSSKVSSVQARVMIITDHDP